MHYIALGFLLASVSLARDLRSCNTAETRHQLCLTPSHALKAKRSCVSQVPMKQPGSLIYACGAYLLRVGLLEHHACIGRCHMQQGCRCNACCGQLGTSSSAICAHTSLTRQTETLHRRKDMGEKNHAINLYVAKAGPPSHSNASLNTRGSSLKNTYWVASANTEHVATAGPPCHSFCPQACVGPELHTAPTSVCTTCQHRRTLRSLSPAAQDAARAPSLASLNRPRGRKRGRGQHHRRGEERREEIQASGCALIASRWEQP